MYHIVYGLLYLFSLLPLRLLYLFADLGYVVLYYILRYRRQVVMSNLKIAFPEKSKEERLKIAKKFYRNFTDSFMETLKLFSAGKQFIMKHVDADFSLFDRFYDEGKKCQVHLGHTFNWELGNLYTGLRTKQPFLGVYLPLDNRIMDRVFKKMRSRFGTHLIPATEMRRAMLPYRHTPYILGLVADQSPAHRLAGYWVYFFGMPTSFMRGPERGAVAGNHPVVFSHMARIRRGYYRIYLELGAEDATGLQPGEITRRYVRYLERIISENPETWLWSHRRWKHQWQEDYGPVLQ